MKCRWGENTLTQFRPFSWRARICLQQLPSPILYHWWSPNLHHCKRWRSVLFNSHKQQRLFWKSGGYRWLSAHARLCECTNVCVWWFCAKIYESSTLYMCICKWGKMRTLIYAFVLVSLGDLLLWSNKPTVSMRFCCCYIWLIFIISTKISNFFYSLLLHPLSFLFCFSFSLSLPVYPFSAHTYRESTHVCKRNESNFIHRKLLDWLMEICEKALQIEHQLQTAYVISRGWSRQRHMYISESSFFFF